MATAAGYAPTMVRGMHHLNTPFGEDAAQVNSAGQLITPPNSRNRCRFKWCSIAFVMGSPALLNLELPLKCFRACCNPARHASFAPRFLRFSFLSLHATSRRSSFASRFFRFTLPSRRASFASRFLPLLRVSWCTPPTAGSAAAQAEPTQLGPAARAGPEPLRARLHG